MAKRFENQENFALGSYDEGTQIFSGFPSKKAIAFEMALNPKLTQRILWLACHCFGDDSPAPSANMFTLYGTFEFLIGREVVGEYVIGDRRIAGGLSLGPNSALPKFSQPNSELPVADGGGASPLIFKSSSAGLTGAIQYAIIPAIKINAPITALRFRFDEYLASAPTAPGHLVFLWGARTFAQG